MTIDSGVLDIGKDHMRIYQEFKSPGSDTIAATVTSLVQLHHGENEVYRPFPGFAQKAAGSLICEVPDHVKPRSIALEGPMPGGSKELAEQLGLKLISAGRIGPAEVDTWGRLQTYCFMGRISDGIGTLMKGLRKDIAAQSSGDMQIGGAALEYRLVYHGRPKLGDVVGVYACLSKVTEKIFVLNHWTVDMATGMSYCSSEDVAISLDLVARKAVSIPQEFQEAYKAHVVDDLDQHIVS